MSEMLQLLPDFIASSARDLEQALPLNPHLRAQIEAKAAVLARPKLANEIVNGAQYFATRTASRDGTTVQVVTVFMLDSMRTRATQIASRATLGVPILEDFFAVPYPRDVFRIWYGFRVGSSGGAGAIAIEDQGTYEARTPATRLPYEAILFHEVGHGYIPHEGLNQFLEIYAHNFLQTQSKDLRSWTAMRGYVPFATTNAGVHALLDVYQLIGWQAMANAYRIIHTLRPPYGVLLSAENKQVFVDQAPAEVKAQVTALVARITF